MNIEIETLTPAQKAHIKENHQFETIGRMSSVLSAPEYLVRAYILRKGWTAARWCRKRTPDQSAGELFDIDKYALENFAI